MQALRRRTGWFVLLHTLPPKASAASRPTIQFHGGHMARRTKSNASTDAKDDDGVEACAGTTTEVLVVR